MDRNLSQKKTGRTTISFPVSKLNMLVNILGASPRGIKIQKTNFKTNKQTRQASGNHTQ